MDMQEAFDDFVSIAMTDLETRQQRLRAEFDLDGWATWWYRKETGKLEFENEQSQVMVQADVMFIGSYSRNSGTWKWAWCNEHLSPEERSKADDIRLFAEVTGFPVFDIDEPIEVDEETAWQLSAMVVMIMNAEGLYCGPNKDGQNLFFMAMNNVRRLSDEERVQH